MEEQQQAQAAAGRTTTSSSCCRCQEAGAGAFGETEGSASGHG